MSDKKTRLSSAEYGTVHRHIDYYIQRVVGSSDSVFNLDELRKLIAEETGFRFWKKTLRKYLRRCEEELGEAPLQELYRLNPEYFQKFKVKAPNPYGPRKK